MNIRFFVLAVFVKIAMVQSGESTSASLPLIFPRSAIDGRMEQNNKLLRSSNEDEMKEISFRSTGDISRPNHQLSALQEVPKFFPSNKDRLAVTNLPADLGMNIRGPNVNFWPLERVTNNNQRNLKSKDYSAALGDLSGSAWYIRQIPRNSKTKKIF